MSIFRAYDIRGVFGRDLTVEVAKDIGRAFGTVVGGGTIAVGRDIRLSGEKLAGALIEGILSSGVDVLDVGVVPTPLLYYTVYTHNTSGGVMITGSHNPPEYNGFKFMRGHDTLHGEQILSLEKIIEGGAFASGEGKLTKIDVADDYINHVKENIKLDKKIKAVVDSGNGTGGLIAPRLYRELGCEVIELFSEPDGSFPNHFPDPTIDEALNDLIKKVREAGADVGIAFDGDGDRAGFVTEDGGIVRGDQALALFSRPILAENLGGKIIFEVKCSKALIDDIRAHGGEPIMYRTGHSFIKKKIREERAQVAGEMSGHFFFADRFFGFDDALYAGARMFELLSKSPEKMSELVGSLPKYESTPEIRVDCPDEKKFEVVSAVTKAFQEKNLDIVTVDGARIQFPDGWGLIRASNTTPKLILRFEAKTAERLKEIRGLVEGELKKHI